MAFEQVPMPAMCPQVPPPVLEQPLSPQPESRTNPTSTFLSELSAVVQQLPALQLQECHHLKGHDWPPTQLPRFGVQVCIKRAWVSGRQASCALTAPVGLADPGARKESLSPALQVQTVRVATFASGALGFLENPSEREY